MPIRRVYGDVEAAVCSGRSDLDRAVRFVLERNIAVPATEDIYKMCHKYSLTAITKSELLSCSALKKEEIATVRKWWAVLLKEVGIKNELNFCIDLLVRE